MDKIEKLMYDFQIRELHRLEKLALKDPDNKEIEIALESQRKAVIELKEKIGVF